TSTNGASFYDISLELDGGVTYKSQQSLFPLASIETQLPDISASGTHELIVRGLDSLSITGLAGYTIRLPSTLEFVSVQSDRSSAPVPLTGRKHGDLLVLYPLGGPPHVWN